jgi:hypothetical protein
MGSATLPWNSGRPDPWPYLIERGFGHYRCPALGGYFSEAAQALSRLFLLHIHPR